MQNILEILKGINMEVPKDKVDTLNEKWLKITRLLPNMTRRSKR